MAHRIGCGAPEHHVELREAEHKTVGRLDQDDIGRLPQRLRQPGRELQPAEAGPQHHNPHRHLLSDKLRHDAMVRLIAHSAS
jgi:hypothetical protein